MKSSHPIQIVPSKNIDKEMWNACVINSENGGLMYAHYEYLQEMTDHWDGIVVNEYEAVMPLPYRKKWGIRYCYDVPFIQQLGMFGNYDTKVLKEVIDTATQHIRFGDLFFNANNKVADVLPSIEQKCNLILHLNQPYHEISKEYNNHLKTKLKQSKSKELFFQIDNDFSEAIALFKSLYAARLSHIKQDNFLKLERLAHSLYETKRSFTCTVFGSDKNILARALFFKDELRIYNILPSTTSEGRKQNAMHFLLDQLIQHYSGTQYALDFEGSDIPGIKAFYQSFGASNETYYHYHFNHLPMPIKWLKR